MCEPATITMGLLAVSSAYTLYSTKENARRQERAFRKAQEVEEDQIRDQASVDANERNRQARAERARLRATSAESGVAGLSIDDILNDVDFQAGMDIANMETNLTNRVNASRTGLGSRLNSIEQPDYLGETLNAGLRIYSANQQANGQ